MLLLATGIIRPDESNKTTFKKNNEIRHKFNSILQYKIS